MDRVPAQTTNTSHDDRPILPSRRPPIVDLTQRLSPAMEVAQFSRQAPRRSATLPDRA